ncbi:PadR family transcriptional regulator [Cohnella sp. AR92]|uniref:PadR family transcriptional regulator n=1 Tax=Cohnella sp. AR92 TaxID=648716 RepID=UPI001315A41E|nr:PadR family transcriptional regulator [Cohnella sp. AR92]
MYAILGIIAHGPRSGYDIRKQFNASLRFFWSESYGQIYPMLKQIEREGYAEPVESNDSRRKKLYRITPEGQTVFRQWLSEPVNPINYRDELLLKIFVAGPQDAKAILALLASEREELEKNVAVLKEQESQALQQYHNRVPPTWMLTLRYGIHSMEARLRWCEEAIHDLRGKGEV